MCWVLRTPFWVIVFLCTFSLSSGKAIAEPFGNQCSRIQTLASCTLWCCLSITLFAYLVFNYANERPCGQSARALVRRLLPAHPPLVSSRRSSVPLLPLLLFTERERERERDAKTNKTQPPLWILWIRTIIMKSRR